MSDRFYLKAFILRFLSQDRTCVAFIPKKYRPFVLRLVVFEYNYFDRKFNRFMFDFKSQFPAIFFPYRYRYGRSFMYIVRRIIRFRVVD